MALHRAKQARPTTMPPIRLALPDLTGARRWLLQSEQRALHLVETPPLCRLPHLVGRGDRGTPLWLFAKIRRSAPPNWP